MMQRYLWKESPWLSSVLHGAGSCWSLPNGPDHRPRQQRDVRSSGDKDNKQQGYAVRTSVLWGWDNSNSDHSIPSYVFLSKMLILCLHRSSAMQDLVGLLSASPWRRAWTPSEDPTYGTCWFCYCCYYFYYYLFISSIISIIFHTKGRKGISNSTITELRVTCQTHHHPTTLSRTKNLSKTCEPMDSTQLTAREGDHCRIITAGEETHGTRPEAPSICKVSWCKSVRKICETL